MKQRDDFNIEVDDEGRLVLPPEIRERYGIRPNSRVRSRDRINGLFLSSPTRLAKLYLEPTNQCNLDCRICIRKSWEEPMGMMSGKDFDRVIDGLQCVTPPPAVVLGGFGEPLMHPDIVDIVRRIKKSGAPVELITNGTLLKPDLSRELIAAGIDLLWVSLDGARPETYADIRLEADLPEVLRNLRDFREILHNGIRYDYRQLFPGIASRIGIVFVAMKRNIRDLPAVIDIGRKLGAGRFMVTNVLPYTGDISCERLYDCKEADWERTALPRLDRDKAIFQALAEAGPSNPALAPIHDGGELGRCPFIETGSAAVGWDGGFSPCLPLMHSHTHYCNDRERYSKRWVIGNLADRSLSELWNDPEHLAFRKQVQLFDFSPCTICHGCLLLEENKEDCLGNQFPTCGGCLWAQGYIQCP